VPIYEYKCRDCDKGFEVSRSMFDTASGDVKCPSCGSTHAERVYSSVYAKTSKKS
jgi:putative FmdB family regulatory protein